MGRADWGKPSVPVNAGELEKVLDHYGVRFTHRTSQMTNCPLHEDRTPSLSINLDKQVWNCHSCGEAGGPAHMIARKEGVDLGRARTIGADRSLLTGGIAKGGDAIQRVSASGESGRRRLAGNPRNNSGDGSYSPAWRRRRSNRGA